jgi:type I restriction enzyme R subunit
LTHHHLKNLGKRAMSLSEGEAEKLYPITEAGSGSVQEPQKVYMAAIIAKLNDLFGNETSNQDQLVYVNNVIRGKLLESKMLQQQAVNNSKAQFDNSPDIDRELDNAIMGAMDAHMLMSTRALNSPAVRRGMKELLLNYSGLYETLRAEAAR